MSGAARNRDGWLPVLTVGGFLVLALGSRAAWPAAGGGHGGGFSGGGDGGGSSPRGREFGGRGFGGRPVPHEHDHDHDGVAARDLLRHRPIAGPREALGERTGVVVEHGSEQGPARADPVDLAGRVPSRARALSADRVGG